MFFFFSITMKSDPILHYFSVGHLEGFDILDCTDGDATSKLDIDIYKMNQAILCEPQFSHYKLRYVAPMEFM